MFPQDIVQQCRELVAAAQAAGLKIATAESCTGGLLSGAITAINGSSAVFEYGFVTYANAAKADLLGVPRTVLDTHGAVSMETAYAMAAGARARAGADVAVSVTGIAGPGGGTPQKPVGLVYFGCAVDGAVTGAVRRFGNLGREEVRLASVRQALTMLARAAEARGAGPSSRIGG